MYIRSNYMLQPSSDIL